MLLHHCIKRCHAEKLKNPCEKDHIVNNVWEDPSTFGKLSRMVHFRCMARMCRKQNISCFGT